MSYSHSSYLTQPEYSSRKNTEDILRAEKGERDIVILLQHFYIEYK
jgi:hypothetical protein